MKTNLKHFTLIVIAALLGICQAEAYTTADMRSAHKILKFFGAESDYATNSLQKMGYDQSQINNYYNKMGENIIDSFNASPYSFGMTVSDLANIVDMMENAGYIDDILIFQREGKVILNDADFVEGLLEEDDETMQVQMCLQLMVTLLSSANGNAHATLPRTKNYVPTNRDMEALRNLFDANNEISRLTEQLANLNQLSALVGVRNDTDKYNRLKDFLNNHYLTYARAVYGLVFTPAELDRLAEIYRTDQGRNLSKQFRLTDLNLEISDLISLELYNGFDKLDCELMKRYQASYPFISSKISDTMSNQINEILK